MHITSNYNTVWEIDHPDPTLRTEMVGQPVPANTKILIRHCATCHYLASDMLEYGNDFGIEYEVNVHSYATKNKSQNLALESVGSIAPGVPTKFQNSQNSWVIATSPDPSFDWDLEEAKFSVDDLLKDIKTKLLERGAYGIRGLGRIFRILDDNRNHQLDSYEFMNGLRDYGFGITDDQAKELIKKFDRNNDGQIHFDEFLRYIRGDINQFRQGLIMQAYNKLDVNQDGSVKLDDVARLYDASHHPDVVAGKSSPEDVYREFMSQWDTQVADGVVTPDEFLDYFKDVSASIDSDEYFHVMMQNAWKL